MPDDLRLQGRTLLVVEDEYLIAVELARWLRDAGAEVLGPVGRLEQALELVEDEGDRIDAAVLDINLGQGVTAYPLAERLERLGVRYVFATGDVTVKPAFERPVLEKPVLERELIRALAALLEDAPLQRG